MSLDLLKLLNRRRFFDDYGQRPAERSADLPPRGVRLSCPCCGYPTLMGRATFEICKICWWEDDGQDDDDADEVRGGPNSDYSLTEARANFQQFLVKYPPDQDTRIGGPDGEQLLALKKELIETFEAMRAEPSSQELNELWRRIRFLEKRMDEDVRARIH